MRPSRPAPGFIPGGRMGAITKLLLLLAMAGLVAAIVVWDKIATTGPGTSAPPAGGGTGTTGTSIVKTLTEVKDKAGAAIESLEIRRRAEETLAELDLKRRAGQMIHRLGESVDGVAGGPARHTNPGRREAPREPESGTRSAPEDIRHVVREGDTLWSIAQKHYGDGAQARRIEEANRDVLQSSRHLRIGTTLRIPPGAGDAAAGNVEKPIRRSEPRREPDTRGGPRTYRVQPGDTLWGIARQELGDGSRWKILYEANRDLLVKPGDLKCGMEIRIPDDGR